MTVAVELLSVPAIRPPETACASPLARSAEIASTVTLLAPAFVPFATEPPRYETVCPFEVAFAVLAPIPTRPPATPFASLTASAVDCDLIVMSPARSVAEERVSMLGVLVAVARDPVSAMTAPEEPNERANALSSSSLMAPPVAVL